MQKGIEKRDEALEFLMDNAEDCEPTESINDMQNNTQHTDLTEFSPVLQRKRNYNANLLKYLKQKHSSEADHKKRNLELEEKRLLLEEKRLRLEEKRLSLKEQKLNIELERNQKRDEEMVHLFEKQHEVTIKLLEIITKK
ncbi:hypothetical protein CDAR_226431 [Caerostris darwini]|uniref:Uncharacterized protein n=1 Tax=Caerostris darwini TaxID=1538125 RepID=A0AAV4V5D9_9ARAC|nr:hypothetical protein CDAR_226431 [Caerostris darwini]